MPKFTRISLFSGKENTMDIDVTEEQLNNWQRGALIQDALPDLTPAEREFLISGMTEDEWNEIMLTPPLPTDEDTTQ